VKRREFITLRCGRVDYTFLSQQRTFSALLTNSANFFRA
jgi:hypothetical protein